MKLSPVLLVLGAASAVGADRFDELPQPIGGQHHIPTSKESAVMGRRILRLTKLATFSTVFPPSALSLHRSSYDDEAGLAGLPIGLNDYVADCEDSGNPTVLEIKIGTTFRNVRAGSNVTVSMRWIPPFPPSRRIGDADKNATESSSSSSSPPPSSWLSPWSWLTSLTWLSSPGLSSFRSWLFDGRAACDGRGPNPEDPRIPDTVSYSADNLPRFALFGHLEPMNVTDEQEAERLRRCYTAMHPDSRYWLPGNRIHASTWARMVVSRVYWVGGFGNRAYIGWISGDEWHAVSEKDIGAIKLPGETAGWSELSAWDTQEL